MKGLYIHIPFCLKKCSYCDFVSFSNKESYHEAYIDKLIQELLKYKNYNVDTIFIGGGTPTILAPELIERLLFTVRKHFPYSQEFSIEANPKTLDEQKLSILKKNGVNRLSIGIQSFNDNELKMLGRVHTALEGEQTILLAREYIPNFNMDIMTALPLQTMNTLMNTLNKAISLNPTHISCYSLIIEENTPFYDLCRDGKMNLPTDEQDREMYHNICAYLKENGYNQYEISNFAKTGYECRHNIKYWKCEEYIGVGIAAHSYLDGKRFYNVSSMEKYLNGIYSENEPDILTREDKIGEFMIMGLRMNEGISEDEFKIRFGEKIEDLYSKQLNKFIRLGLINYNNKRYMLTERGFDLSNSILCEFL